jgi:hypothetical protein
MMAGLDVKSVPALNKLNLRLCVYEMRYGFLLALLEQPVLEVPQTLTGPQLERSLESTLPSGPVR